MVGFACWCGDKKRAPRGASGGIANVLFSYLDANYMSYSVVENSSNCTLDFSLLCGHILHQHKVK